MKPIYNAITAALQAKATQFNLLGVEPPETFDIHLSQELNPEDYEFALPAIFYDYSVDFSAEYIYVYLYIVQEYKDDTENFAINRDAGLNFFDFLTAIKRCVNGVRTDNKAYGKLELYQEQPQQNDLYYCHLLTLRCTYRANSDPDLIEQASQEEFTLDLKKGRLRDRVID